MMQFRKMEISQSALWGYWLGVISIVLFWLLLFARGFPRPHVDDGFYIGAGIQLFRGHGFVNPFCDSLQRWPFTEGFYAYLPGQSYILTGWLHLFGLSELSMRALPTFCAMGASFGLYRFFSPSKYSVVAALGISTAILVFLGGTGLRPDSIGLFLFAMGLEVFRSRNIGSYFVGNLCLAMVLITYANLAYGSLLVTAGSLVYQAISESNQRRKLLQMFLVAGMAYGLTFFYFLWCIDFHLSDFAIGIRESQKIGMEVVKSHFHLRGTYALLKWGAFQIPFLILISYLFWWYRSDKRRLLLIFLFIANYVALAWACRSSVSAVHLWAMSCVIAAFYLVWNGIFPSGERTLAIWFIFLGFLVVFHGHYMLVDLLCDHQINTQQNSSIKAMLAEFKTGKIYLDAYAIRELYGYDLPPNAFDYCQSSLSGWLEPHSYEDIPSNSLAVTSISFAFHDHGFAQCRPLFGVLQARICRNPYDLVIMDRR